MGIALVTGGTSGIGATFARQLAAKGDDIVLVARNTERLDEMAHELRGMGREVEVLPADLSKRADVARVVKRLEDTAKPIDMLVNNAGFGMHSKLSDADSSGHDFAFEVMVRSVRELAAASARAMRARGRGRIINVSSTAGFITTSSGYSAIKAWVTNFSESVAGQVRPLGVRVMALCPGYTRSEFHQRAAIDMSKTPNWLWLDADRVVADGMRDLRLGRTVSVPDWKYKGMVFAMRHLPRPLLKVLARDTRGRLGR